MTIVPVSVKPRVEESKGYADKIKAASNLAAHIKKDWNTFDTEELAEKIVELSERTSFLTEELGSSPVVRKVQKQAESLYFKFVFPVALELDSSKTADFRTFSKTVNRLANTILTQNSLLPFQELDAKQQQEVSRYALKGG